MAEFINLTDSDSETQEEDDPNIPSRDECEARCQMFAEITGTDTALAMFYLQDREWIVERALNDYYTERGINDQAVSELQNTSILPAASESLAQSSRAPQTAPCSDDKSKEKKTERTMKSYPTTQQTKISSTALEQGRLREHCLNLISVPPMMAEMNF